MKATSPGPKLKLFSMKFQLIVHSSPYACTNRCAQLKYQADILN